MKKIVITLLLLFLGVFLAAGTAGAATTILPGPEVPLIGDGIEGNDSILDRLYDLNNLTRIPDGLDHTWNPATGYATAQAKYAAFEHSFGYIRTADGVYNELFKVGPDLFELLPTIPGYTGTLSGGGNFLWALDPDRAPLWTSDPDKNSDSLDHMVTWLISGGDGDRNEVRKYVIAWEDLYGGGDQDYNDLVVEVTVAPVPIPAAILLLGSGLVGLAAIRKKFNR